MKCNSQVWRLRRAKLERLAATALGSTEAADSWLRTPNAALSGGVPDALIFTLEGFEQVVGELESIASR